MEKLAPLVTKKEKEAKDKSMSDFNAELVSTINYMRQCELISEEKKTVMVNLLSGVSMFFPDTCMKEFVDVVRLCGSECMLVPTSQNIDSLLAKSQSSQSMFFQVRETTKKN